MPVHLTCSACGAPFLCPEYRASRAKFCSMVCRRAGAPALPIDVSADGTSARVPLVGRDGSIRAYATIDAADAPWAGQWTWRLDSKGYAKRGEGAGDEYVHVFLHRELLGLPRTTDGREGDHRDRVRLNCVRSNLRIVPRGGNAQNQSVYGGCSSSYRGVSWRKDKERWQSYFRCEGKRVHLGYFRSEQEAAEAARAARLSEMTYAID
jgi:hypothetical protein